MILLCASPEYATAGEWQLLRFRADWCSPCVAQKSVFNANELSNHLRALHVKDVYVDFDKNPNAVRKWKVKSIPCTLLVYVYDDNKAAVVRQLGGDTDHPHHHMLFAEYRQFVSPPSVVPSR